MTKPKSLILNYLTIALLALIIGFCIGFTTKQPDNLKCERAPSYLKEDYRVCREVTTK